MPELRAADAAADPFAQFAAWFAEARDAVPVPEAMVVSTATPCGAPSARMVLLKETGEDGFVFFTNYGSRKGRELAENPRAALVFYWAGLDRQVRIEGTVERTSREESEAYFISRPLGSRLGAWASPQSRPIVGRGELARRLREAEERFGEEVPLPESWGGYRVRPETVEFWQGRPSRLHDRLLYSRAAGGGWQVERLAP